MEIMEDTIAAIEMCIRDRWCSPLEDVLPIYMPGRFLTASNPSNI